MNLQRNKSRDRNVSTKKKELKLKKEEVSTKIVYLSSSLSSEVSN
jgi:hypothetical protein